MNQAALKGEAVAHVLIGKNGSSQIMHDLMHLDQNAAGLLRVKGNRLDVRIDLAPLVCPVSANFFASTDKTAFERSRPSYVRSHQGNGGVNVSRVKGCVSRTEQFDFWRRSIRHKGDGEGDAAGRNEHPLVFARP
jgi:hypothetical protein